MREIKFRAWSPVKKEFVNVGHHFDISNTTEHSEASVYQGVVTDSGDVGELVLMQCTGLKDKNGKEIYEGDILIDDEYPEDGIGYAKVEWEGAGWVVNPWFSSSEFAKEAETYEVIGNIYENPDVLQDSPQLEEK